MNWNDIAKQVIALGAPIIGTALGGPLGGAAGAILADALGVEATPDAVGKAIESDPAAAVAAQTAEIEWAKSAAVIAASAAQQSSAINATLRAELASGVGWWHWRHLLGYVLLIQAAVFSYAVAKDLLANNFAGINAAISLAAAFTPYFLGFCALLGYVASDTSRLRAVALTGERKPDLIQAAGSLVKALRQR